jgi:hypothetical protein
VKFKNADAAALDVQSANTAGDYYTASLNLSRLQNLGTKGTQGYLGIYGQYSPYNLDSAEQYRGVVHSMCAVMNRASLQGQLDIMRRLNLDNACLPMHKIKSLEKSLWIRQK